MRTQRIHGLVLAALLAIAVPLGQPALAGATRAATVDVARVAQTIQQQKESRSTLQIRLHDIPSLGAAKAGQPVDMNQVSVAMPNQQDEPKIAEQPMRAISYVAQYAEPNDPAHRNYCGPGAATVVISHWDADYARKGDIDQLAADMDIDPDSGVWVRDIVKPLNERINAAVGQELNWYRLGEASNIDEFRYMLQFDIVENGVPLITSLQTGGLPGWEGQDVGHIVAVYGYGVGADGTEYVTYADTAPAAAGYQSDAFHTIELQTFWEAVSGNSAQVW